MLESEPSKEQLVETQVNLLFELYSSNQNNQLDITSQNTILNHIRRLLFYLDDISYMHFKKIQKLFKNIKDGDLIIDKMTFSKEIQCIYMNCQELSDSTVFNIAQEFSSFDRKKTGVLKSSNLAVIFQKILNKDGLQKTNLKTWQMNYVLDKLKLEKNFIDLEQILGNYITLVDSQRENFCKKSNYNTYFRTTEDLKSDYEIKLAKIKKFKELGSNDDELTRQIEEIKYQIFKTLYGNTNIKPKSKINTIEIKKIIKRFTDAKNGLASPTRKDQQIFKDKDYENIGSKKNTKYTKSFTNYEGICGNSIPKNQDCDFIGYNRKFNTIKSFGDDEDYSESPTRLSPKIKYSNEKSFVGFSGAKSPKESKKVFEIIPCNEKNFNHKQETQEFLNNKKDFVIKSLNDSNSKLNKDLIQNKLIKEKSNQNELEIFEIPGSTKFNTDNKKYSTHNNILNDIDEHSKYPKNSQMPRERILENLKSENLPNSFSEKNCDKAPRMQDGLINPILSQSQELEGTTLKNWKISDYLVKKNSSFLLNPWVDNNVKLTPYVTKTDEDKQQSSLQYTDLVNQNKKPNIFYKKPKKRSKEMKLKEMSNDSNPINDQDINIEDYFIRNLDSFLKKIDNKKEKFFGGFSIKRLGELGSTAILLQSEMQESINKVNSFISQLRNFARNSIHPKDDVKNKQLKSEKKPCPETTIPTFNTEYFNQYSKLAQKDVLNNEIIELSKRSNMKFPANIDIDESSVGEYHHHLMKFEKSRPRTTSKMYNRPKGYIRNCPGDFYKDTHTKNLNLFGKSIDLNNNRSDLKKGFKGCQKLDKKIR